MRPNHVREDRPPAPGVPPAVQESGASLLRVAKASWQVPVLSRGAASASGGLRIAPPALRPTPLGLLEAFGAGPGDLDGESREAYELGGARGAQAASRALQDAGLEPVAVIARLREKAMLILQMAAFSGSPEAPDEAARVFAAAFSSEVERLAGTKEIRRS